jgi:hypothetical protein
MDSKQPKVKEMWAFLQVWWSNFSWSHRLFLILQVVAGLWAFYLFIYLPNPGWAVAILAGVAAAMSIHGNMRGWQKAIWMILIGLLLVVELRSISKDRSDSDTRALGDRRAQDLAFKSVRDVQDADFKATADGLKTAISGIQSTLNMANTTLRQTQPRAVLRLDRWEFYPNFPSEIKANTSYQINYYFQNGGTGTATKVQKMARIYIGDADDKKAQIRLVRKFNIEWKQDNISKVPVIVPNTPLFDSLDRTFTDDEMKDFSLNKTIYILVRFEYSDETGRWRTDACNALQRGSTTIFVYVKHTCLTFENSRYAVKQWP